MRKLKSRGVLGLGLLAIACAPDAPPAVPQLVVDTVPGTLLYDDLVGGCRVDVSIGLVGHYAHATVTEFSRGGQGQPSGVVVPTEMFLNSYGSDRIRGEPRVGQWMVYPGSPSTFAVTAALPDGEVLSGSVTVGCEPK